jgi:IclR family transcriptional regulator, acetate operon repressor
MALVTLSPLARSLELLELLVPEPDGLSVTTISQHSTLPKSVVHRTLAGLVELGFVEQDALSQRYRLTLKLASLGIRHLAATGIAEVTRPILNEVAAATGEFVRLAVVEGERLLWIARAQGARSALRYEPRTGPDVILHSTATGAAWLATLPEEEAVRVVLTRGFATAPDYGLKAVRSVPQLLDKLRRTRAQGYGVALEEGEPGTNAIAVAFRADERPDAPVAGTVSVAGPGIRLTEERLHALAPLLHDAAQRIAAVWPVRRHLIENEAVQMPAEETVEVGGGG